MKKFVIATLIVGVSCGPLLARIGERADDIDNAYGDVVERRLLDDGSLNIVYHSGSYLYSVTFANGRSVLERYSRFNGRGLSRKEIDKFLKANAGGATWTLSDASGQRFKRSDGAAEAAYSEVSGRLALTVRQLRADRGGREQ